MSDERKIRFNGEEFGPFTIDALHRQVMKGKFDHTAEFFSELKNQWLPLAGIGNDFDPNTTTEERLRQMKRAGIKRVELLGSPNKGECGFCKELATKIYPIDEVPTIPPANCSCVPWCFLLPLAHR